MNIIRCEFIIFYCHQDLVDCLTARDEWTSIVAKEVALHTAALVRYLILSALFNLQSSRICFFQNEPLGGVLPISLKDSERQKFVLPLGLGGSCVPQTEANEFCLIPMSQPNVATVVFHPKGTPDFTVFGSDHHGSRNAKKKRSSRSRRGSNGEKINNGCLVNCESDFSLDRLGDPFSMAFDSSPDVQEVFGYPHHGLFGTSSSSKSKNKKKSSSDRLSDHHFLFGDSFDVHEKDIEKDWARFDTGEEMRLDSPSTFSIPDSFQTPDSFEASDSSQICESSRKSPLFNIAFKPVPSFELDHDDDGLSGSTAVEETAESKTD